MHTLGQLSAWAARSFAALLFGLSIFAGTAHAGERTCMCDVTCNGASRSTSIRFPDTVFAPTTPQRQACADTCRDWAQSHMTQWANELGKQACNSMQCAGSSKLSTGDPIGIGPLNLDTSGFQACKPIDGGGTGTTNPCCPDFTKEIKPGNVASMFAESQHGLGQPYTMTFSSNGTFSNAFEGYLKEWAHWLSIDGCRGTVGFKITYQLFNTNSPNKPTGPNPPTGSSAAVQTQTVNYIGTNVSPPSFVWNVPASPNWWFVKATVTPIGQNGQPVACTKSAGCMDRIYTGWIDDAMTTAKVAGGAPQQGRIRILD